MFFPPSSLQKDGDWGSQLQLLLLLANIAQNYGGGGGGSGGLDSRARASRQASSML